MERLQKVMARAGIASRRKCEDIIAKGGVTVNGKVVTALGFKVNPTQDKIKVFDQNLTQISYQYLILNKPPHYITSKKDPQNRPKVMDLLPSELKHLNPVGRLDYLTAGLLLLTNDGDLTYQITHPKFLMPKTYLLYLKEPLPFKKQQLLRGGVDLSDGKTAPAQLAFVKKQEANYLYQMTIIEGRNRQIRRMFEAIAFPLTHLKRIKIGNLELQNLPQGQYRFLTMREIRELKDNAQGFKGD